MDESALAQVRGNRTCSVVKYAPSEPCFVGQFKCSEYLGARLLKTSPYTHSIPHYTTHGKRRKVFGNALTLSALISAFFLILIGAADAQQSSDQVFEDAYQEILKDPGNLDKSFRFTQLAIERGDFEAAISALERMLITNPTLSRVRLELGVLYFRLGSYPLAKSYLESAVKGEAVPQTVRDRVGVFLSEIDDRLSASRVFGSVNVGLRHQTNANSGPSSSSVLLFGFPAELDDAYTSQKDGNFFGALDLHHIYDFATQDRTTLDTDFFVFGSKQLEQEQVDVIFSELVVGPRFHVPATWSGNTLVRPFVRGSMVRLGENILYRSFGGGVEVSKQINDGLGVTLRYGVRKKRFDDTVSRPTATNKNGIEHLGEVTAEVSITATVNAFTRARITDRNARVNYETNREYGGLVGLSVSHAPPLGNPSRRWLTSVSSEFSYMKDDAPHPAVSPTTRRMDRRWDVRLQTNIPLARPWSLGIGATHSRIGSNLPNFEQTNTAVAVSVSRSF